MRIALNPSNAKSVSVSVSGTDPFVVKRQNPELAKMEYRRTISAYALARRQGLFHVPEPVAFDERDGVITFERMPRTVVTLKEALQTRSNVSSLIQKSAEVLAIIHREFSPNVDNNGSLTDEVRPTYGHAHGDYSLVNLFWEPNDCQLWIIDWMPPVWLQHLSSDFPTNIDLIVFLSSLFVQRPFSGHVTKEPEKKAELFLKKYERCLSVEWSQVRQTFFELDPLYRSAIKNDMGPVGYLARLTAFWRFRSFANRRFRSN